MKPTFIKILMAIAIFNTGLFAQAFTGKLVEMNGKTVTGSKAYISMDWQTGKLTGHTGCNRMTGSFTSDGNSISFSQINSTRMFCKGNSEKQFIRALRDATRYNKTGDRLRVYSGRRQVLRFETTYDDGLPAGDEQPHSDQVPGPLESMKWVLDKEYSGIDESSTAAPFIKFTPDSKGLVGINKGSAGGNAGCNVFGGSYTVQGRKIAVTEIISTMRACVEDDRMNIERRFLDGLQKADRYDIRGEQLFLYQDSKLVLRFKGSKK